MVAQPVGGVLSHEQLRNDANGTVLDVNSKLDRGQKPEGVNLWRL